MNDIILHQPSNCTKFNRHPEIFKKATILKKEVKSILSFGCLTGEECYTLRKYFPESKIIGAEINKSLVKLCENKNSDKNIKFVHSEFENLKKHSPYDFIFAINVFNRDLKEPHKYPLYVFSYFEDQIIQFDGIIKATGILVLVNSKHDFEKTNLFIKNRYSRCIQTGINKNFYQKIS